PRPRLLGDAEKQWNPLRLLVHRGAETLAERSHCHISKFHPAVPRPFQFNGTADQRLAVAAKELSFLEVVHTAPDSSATLRRGQADTRDQADAQYRERRRRHQTFSVSGRFSRATRSRNNLELLPISTARHQARDMRPTTISDTSKMSRCSGRLARQTTV